MSIPGTVPISGPLAPTSTNDEYGTHDAFYGIGGWRNVDTIADRNAIPEERRREGMAVGVDSTGKFYTLNPEPWVYDSSDWTEFVSGSAEVGNLIRIVAGETLTIPENRQSLVYGDVYVEATGTLVVNGKLTIINGTIVAESGATVTVNGTYEEISLATTQEVTDYINDVINYVNSQIPLTNVNLSVFVDPIYGNDSTGAKYDTSKPYRTYAAARAVAVSGDTVVLRPGIYYEYITLVSGVNVHCETGVQLEYAIRDLGSSVTDCKVTGNAYSRCVFSTLANRNIDLSGSNTQVYIELGDIYTTNSAIQLSNSGASNDIIIKCNSITSTFQYPIDLGQSTNLKFYCAGEWNGYYHMLLRDSYAGRSYIEVGNVVCVRGFYSDNTLTGGNGFVKVKVMDRIVQNSNLSSDHTYAFTIMGSVRLDIEADFYSDTYATGLLGVMRGLDQDGDSWVRYSGHAYSENWMLINYSKYGRLLLDNAYLMRGEGQASVIKGRDLTGTDVISLGGSTTWVYVYREASDYLNVELRNCVIKKRSDGTTPPTVHGPIINTHGANSKFFIKDTDIIGENCPASTYAVGASSIANGNVYFRDSHTNLTTNNITDTSVGGTGLTQSDTNLETHFDVI